MSNIEKMHEAKRAARAAEIWEAVEQVRKREKCHCDLRPGMTRDELPTGSGCRDNYICPALDTYRRLLPAPEIPADERALQESA
jgi:hypothetical protein